MSRKLVVEIVGDASSLEKAFTRSTKSAAKFNRDITGKTRVTATAFSNLGRAAAGFGAALGGLAIAGGIKGAVSAASDLNEQLSKTSVVFGQSADDVTAWSKTTSTAMGLAQKDALATASSFGALLRPLGLTGQAAADQSVKLTKLGADLASFYNTDVSSALDAIRSGLLGESEPLRKYGVILSEARVQQEALAETGKKNAKQLTDQEKVLARIALVYKDTAQAQGDFARTSSGLANQQRILSAQFTNLQTNLGRLFLPAVNAAITALNKALPAIDNAITKFGQQRTVQAKLRFVWSGIEQGARTAFDQLRNAFSQIDWGAVLARLKGFGRQIGVALERAYRDIDWQRLGRQLGDYVKASLRLMVRAYQSLDYQQIGRALVRVTGAAIVALVKFLKGVDWAGIAKLLVKLFATQIRNQLNLVAGVGKELGRVLLDALGDALDKAGRALKRKALDIVLQIVEPFTHLPGFLGGGPFQRLKRFLEGQLAALEQPTAKAAATVGQAASQGIAAGITSGEAGIETAMKSVVGTALSAAQDAVTTTTTGSGSGGGTGGLTANDRAQRRNQWFDAMIGRELDRVQDIPTLKGQIRRLEQIKQLVTSRLAVTKDITRRLTLGDTLRDITRRIKDDADEVTQNARDAADAARKAHAEAVKALSEWVKAVNATADAANKAQAQDFLRRKKANEERKKRAREKERRDATAAQFSVLGLGPTGEEILTRGRLAAQLKTVREGIKGTVLDTAKNRARLKAIYSVIVSGVHGMSREVRETVKQMLDDFSQQIADAPKKTKKKRRMIGGIYVDKYGNAIGPGLPNQVNFVDPYTKAMGKFNVAVKDATESLSTLDKLRVFADLRQFGGNLWSRAGVAAMAGMPGGVSASRLENMPRIQFAGGRVPLPLGGSGSGYGSGRQLFGGVTVNQHFNAPTTDRHREARYALMATRAVFDT